MEEFQKLWDEILSQPDVRGIQIVAFRGADPQEGPWDIVHVSESTDPIQQLKDNLDYLKANPYEVDKPKRGRKKKV